MSRITLKITKENSKEAKEIFMKLLYGNEPITEAEWQVLYREGVCQRPRKQHKR